MNVRGMDGDTPLHDAAVNGHLEVSTGLSGLANFGPTPRLGKYELAMQCTIYIELNCLFHIW